MIDWDEINWGKGIAIILAGIIVVGGGIFVLNDYMSFERLDQLLRAQIEDLDNFYSTWQPPSDVDMARLDQKHGRLQDELNSSTMVIPETLDFAELENTIRQQGSGVGVEVSEVNFLAEETRGFFKVQPAVVSFVGQGEPVANFLRLVDMIRYVHEMQADKLTPGEEMKVTINFYIFDKKGWAEFYKCKLAVTFPQIEDADISKVRFFKGNLAQLKSQVTDKQSSLRNAKQAVHKECEMERKIGAIEERIGLIEEITSK